MASMNSALSKPASYPGSRNPAHVHYVISGKGVANPAAMLRSIALLLRHAAAEPELAASLEGAIDQALVATPPADQGGSATTAQFAESVLDGMLEVVR